MIQFKIDGDPIPWKRPGRNNKTGAVYDQQKIEKQQLQWYLRHRYRENPLKTPLKIDFTFFFSMPTGASKARKREMLNGVLHHTSRPDVDNLAKFYLDTMTGVIYDDDAQVCKLGVSKLYATFPYTLIEITPQNCNMDKQSEIEQEGDSDLENDLRDP